MSRQRSARDRRSLAPPDRPENFPHGNKQSNNNIPDVRGLRGGTLGCVTRAPRRPTCARQRSLAGARTLALAGALVLGCNARPRGPAQSQAARSASRPEPSAVPPEAPASAAPSPVASGAAPGDASAPGQAASATPAGPPPLPRLEEAGRVIALEVPGFAPAVVAVPGEATRPRPVLVATHGNYDRPEWQCEVWGAIATRGFVLCPRGIARGDSPSPTDRRFHYASHQALEREALAALAALAARFPAHVDAEGAVYAGFSLGAIMGVPIAQRHAAEFPRLALVEGGNAGWGLAQARAYAASGGKRILFACGQGGCVASSRAAAASLEKAGIYARVVASPREGHTYGGKVATELAGSFGWLTEGDARWR
jgi:predicted esterase